MITIYTVINEAEWAESLYQKLLSKIPEQDQIRNRKFIRWQDRQSNLLGKLLVLFSLTKFKSENTLEQLVFNKHQKPSFVDGPFFNISHSGIMVVCAISTETELGIDVEEIRPINAEDFKSIFTEKEWGLINDKDSNFLSIFYEFWTKKESVIKANGKGLGLKLNTIDVSESNVLLEDKIWQLKKINLHKQYSCHIACEKKESEYQLIEVSLEKIISELRISVL